MVDVGTGDGLLIYNYARQNAHTFFIGIDANRKPLEKVSHKIYRKPAKGGLPNIIFLQAALESLPDELTGIASEVQVNFPWGALLRTVITGDQLGNLRRLCVPNALLKVVVSFDFERDKAEFLRLGLPTLSPDYLSDVLAMTYREAGFEILENEELRQSELRELGSSWAKRLARSSNRSFVRVMARAGEK
ncbi:MAG TPA: 16S rRNA (adenine(1408)-N(1))-methyltransferase NpmA [Pyrinomonadaceae bacterium]|nr:16S rRNA (adenine(1408)-N(1))-methyltransferase NpmA [Pyrinomonadaceae bacterium]